MKKFFKEFGKFISKGNVIDLAVGIIIGTAFQAIVKSLVNDVIMPVIGVIANFNLQDAYAVLVPEIVDSTGAVVQAAVLLRYGAFIQSIIDFLIIGFTIFVTIKIITGAKKRFVKGQIRALKKLRKKHPEFFEKEDSLGNTQYNELKNNYPEFFKDEKTLEKPVIVEEKKPTTEELLTEIVGILKKEEPVK